MAVVLSSRMRVLAALLLSAAWIVSCASTRSQHGSAAQVSFKPAVKPELLETVVVFVPQNERVLPAWKSLRDELAESFNVVPVALSPQTNSDAFARAIAEHSPSCIVLFDNKTANLYSRYQASATQELPPSVILMTSYADLYTKVQNAIGVAFEVPILISATNLRSYISKPVESIGVVHREAFRGYVDNQAALAKVEEIDVRARSIPNDATARELARALADVVDEVDALWVLNDNALLTPEHVTRGWLPVLSKDPIPTIVGIPGLVTTEIPFGTFAVVPDLSALGLQAANLIYDLADYDWEIQSGQGIEQPLSVQTILDVERARAYFSLKEEMLDELGAVVK